MKLLTIRKQKWVNRFKPDVLRGPVLSPNAAIYDRYYRTLEKLINKMTEETRREIERLFKTDAAKDYFAQDASVTSQAKALANALNKKFDNLFAIAAKSAAEKMADDTDKASASNISTSLKEMSGGLSLKTDILTGPLKEVISATVAENVGLIKSIPSKYLDNVQTAVMRSITTGNGLADLVPFLEKQHNLTLKRARLISLDQTRKAYSNINKHRLQALGVEKFEWLHSSGGQHPRKDHVAMNGKIYRFDDPPVIDKRTGERGFPGQLINCFIGSTKVSLDNGCRNLWRYFHSGDVVSLGIEGGSVITSTANHPILTSRGWLPANEIQKGDYLVSSQTNYFGAVDDKVANNVTTFDELFDSLTSIQPAQKRLASEFNFHGDIPKSEVDCITVNQDLTVRGKIIGVEEIEKLVLSFADSSTDFSHPSVVAQVLHSCGPSSFGQSNSFVDREFGHSQAISSATIPQDNTVILKNPCDNISSETKSIRDCKNAITTIIQSDNLTSLGVDEINSGCSWDNITDPLSKSFGNPMRTNFMLGTEQIEGSSFIKRFLRVEKKSISVFAGHVYTMETVAGWFNVSPAMVISKNCRCIMRPVIEFGE